MDVSFAVHLDGAQAQGLTARDVEDVQSLMTDLAAVALSLRRDRRAAAREQLVDLLVGDVALTRVDMRRARLEAQALRAIRQGSEWLTAADIAELAELGPVNPAATIGRWKQQGRIYALRHGGRDFYPRYALGADFHPLPVVRQVLDALKGYTPELLAGWFDSTSRTLGGRRPRELIATAPDKVLAAARRMVEMQEHHG